MKDKALEVGWSFEIKMPKSVDKEVQFHFEKQKNAIQHRLRMKRVTESAPQRVSDLLKGKEESTSPSDGATFSTKDSNFSIRIPPGLYVYQLQSISKNSMSVWSSPQSLLIRLPNANLKGPSNQTKFIAESELDNEISLQWESVTNATYYAVMIFNSKGEMIRREPVLENKFKIKLPHDQTYEWLVRSYQSQEEFESDSDVSGGVSIKVKAKSLLNSKWKFTIDPYIPLNLTSGEEVSQFYAWGRHIGSIENYRSNTEERGSQLESKQFGGTGELGLGRWDRLTGWGWLTNFRLAGFTWANDNFTYLDFGVALGHRMILSENARLRFWYGVNYNELPEITINGETDEVRYSKIKGLGPELRISYSSSFNDLWGLQYNGTLLYAPWAVSTPNSSSQLKMQSYTLSVLLSYNPKDIIDGHFKNFRWLIGYSYHVSEGNYKGVNDNTNNSVSIGGHYLSTAIEFGLEDSKK